MRVVATYNIKGGVGKTSAAVNIAALAANEGMRTLLWDLDPQAAATYLLRVKPKIRGGARGLVRGRSSIDELLKGTDIECLDLLPADLTFRNVDLYLDDTKKPTRGLARALEPLRDDYDLVILDCPPSLSLASEAVFEAVEALLVPLIPTTLSMRATDQLRKFLNSHVNRPPQIIGFFSMVDARKRLHRTLVATVPLVDESILPISIPASVQVEHMGVYRSPITDFAPATAAAQAYRELWSAVRQRLGIDDP
jgi:chromosome partitioning protein